MFFCHNTLFLNPIIVQRAKLITLVELSQPKTLKTQTYIRFEHMQKQTTNKISRRLVVYKRIENRPNHLDERFNRHYVCSICGDGRDFAFAAD